MDKPKAIAARAHELARLIYALLTKGQPYVDAGQDYYEERHRSRVLSHLLVSVSGDIETDLPGEIHQQFTLRQRNLVHLHLHFFVRQHVADSQTSLIRVMALYALAYRCRIFYLEERVRNLGKYKERSGLSSNVHARVTMAVWVAWVVDVLVECHLEVTLKTLIPAV